MSTPKNASESNISSVLDSRPVSGLIGMLYFLRMRRSFAMYRFAAGLPLTRRAGLDLVLRRVRALAGLRFRRVVVDLVERFFFVLRFFARRFLPTRAFDASS